MINAVSYQFNKFVEFAEERVKAGKGSAIARTGEVRIGKGTPLEERAIYSTDKTDFVGMTLLRTKDAKAANDEVRELFRKSIAEMFGGEGNIPDSVKDAMLLKDYGSGKPLTARRAACKQSRTFQTVQSKCKIWYNVILNLKEEKES